MIAGFQERKSQFKPVCMALQGKSKKSSKEENQAPHDKTESLFSTKPRWMSVLETPLGR
jgi:hypothetical protein